MWFPDEFDVRVIAHGLALNIFPGYEDDQGQSGLYARVLNHTALDGALNIPKLPYYRTRIDKGGALLRSIVKDHPFVDGNKRLGMATTFIYLLQNGYVFAPSNDEMIRFALELANSMTMTCVIAGLKVIH